MRADRLLSILLVLQTKGRATARELARQLEVSERTIQRDMEALCVSGIPLLAERGAGGGWSLPDGYRTRLTGLTSEEIQALLLLLQSSSAVRELALEGPSSSALAKLLSALPAAKRSEAEIIRERLHIDLQGWHEPRNSSPLLPVVQQAVWEGRALRIRYDSAMENKRERERIVFPWGLIAKLNTWYFVAAEDAGSSEKELRTFRVSRLLEANLMSDRFEVPSGFDLASWWDRSTASFKESLPWYPAAVRIRKEKWKRFSEERYARVKSCMNAGEEWIEAEVDFHTLESAHDLLLGYGDSAIALQPPELTKAIRSTLAALARTYKDLQTD